MQNYHIVDGRIADPGKFEGEREWVPYFWELMLDGAGWCFDWPDDSETVVIPIYNGDRRQWPDLQGYAYVVIEENSQGFVYGQAITEATFEEIEAQNEREWSGDEAQEDAPSPAINGH
jgi:hypothetical protein